MQDFSHQQYHYILYYTTIFIDMSYICSLGFRSWLVVGFNDVCEWSWLGVQICKPSWGIRFQLRNMGKFGWYYPLSAVIWVKIRNLIISPKLSYCWWLRISPASQLKLAVYACICGGSYRSFPRSWPEFGSINSSRCLKEHHTNRTRTSIFLWCKCHY